MLKFYPIPKWRDLYIVTWQVNTKRSGYNTGSRSLGGGCLTLVQSVHLIDILRSHFITLIRKLDTWIRNWRLMKKHLNRRHTFIGMIADAISRRERPSDVLWEIYIYMGERGRDIEDWGRASHVPYHVVHSMRYWMLYPHVVISKFFENKPSNLRYGKCFLKCATPCAGDLNFKIYFEFELSRLLRLTVLKLMYSWWRIRFVLIYLSNWNVGLFIKQLAVWWSFGVALVVGVCVPCTFPTGVRYQIDYSSALQPFYKRGTPRVLIRLSRNPANKNLG